MLNVEWRIRKFNANILYWSTLQHFPIWSKKERKIHNRIYFITVHHFLQFSLWYDQSSLWHFFPQYQAIRHLSHLFNFTFFSPPVSGSIRIEPYLTLHVLHWCGVIMELSKTTVESRVNQNLKSSRFQNLGFFLASFKKDLSVDRRSSMIEFFFSTISFLDWSIKFSAVLSHSLIFSLMESFSSYKRTTLGTNRWIEAAVEPLYWMSDRSRAPEVVRTKIFWEFFGVFRPTDFKSKVRFPKG